MKVAEQLAARVHHCLISSLIETGFAPDTSELASVLEVPTTDIESAMNDLHDRHGLVLHPDRCAPWIIHPFSLSPSHTWVEQGDLGWWAPCMWCALGIAHLAGGNSKIYAVLEGERERVCIEVTADRVSPEDIVVHFPIPVQAAWRNVHHYCSMVLPFESEAAISGWSARHRLPLGQGVPIKQANELARRWYGDHASPHWTKWTPAQATEIFEGAGLKAPFWHLESWHEP